jgi:hypothetical protein
LVLKNLLQGQEKFQVEYIIFANFTKVPERLSLTIGHRAYFKGYLLAALLPEVTGTVVDVCILSQLAKYSELTFLQSL